MKPSERIRLSEAIPQYIRHLEARGLSRNSRRNHSQPLSRGLAVWGDLQVASIKPAHIDVLYSSQDWSASTRNLYLTGLRGFFSWCRRHNHLPKDYDPTDGWRNVRVPTKDRLWIPVEEFHDLLDAVNHDRDRAVVALGLYTFMRGGEIRTLRISDLDFARNTVSMYRHKTKQADVLPMSEELHTEMVAWLNAYEARMGRALDPDWYLTPSMAPLPMLFDEAKRCLQPTGEPSKLLVNQPLFKPYASVQRGLRALGYDPTGNGVHLLRRSGARALFDRLREEGYDGALMRVSSMLGHANVVTTERYLGLSIERQQRNELLAGKTMFPAARRGATVTRLEEVRHG